MAVFFVGDNGPDGTCVGVDSTKKLAFYGSTPASQRSSGVQATSNVSLTTFMTINTNVAAFCLEVANTLIGLGLWKGS